MSLELEVGVVSSRVRRWAPQLAAAVVLLLTSAVLALTPAPRGLYAIEGHLQLITPNSNGDGNAYRADAGNSTLFAAALERIYNVHPETAQVASTSATLYGIGVRNGSRVTLPSAGSQWTNSFDQPYLRVEVISPDPGVSQARFSAIVARLTSIAQQRQLQAGVVPAAAVHLELSPVVPDVQYVTGRNSRWMLAVGLIGLICASGAHYCVGRISSVRSARRSGPVGPRPQKRRPAAVQPTSLSTHEVSARSAPGPVGAGVQHRSVSG